MRGRRPPTGVGLPALVGQGGLKRRRQGVFTVVALDGLAQELDRAVTDLTPPDSAAS